MCRASLECTSGVPWGHWSKIFDGEPRYHLLLEKRKFALIILFWWGNCSSLPEFAATHFLVFSNRNSNRETPHHHHHLDLERKGMKQRKKIENWKLRRKKEEKKKWKNEKMKNEKMKQKIKEKNKKVLTATRDRFNHIFHFDVLFLRIPPCVAWWFSFDFGIF